MGRYADLFKSDVEAVMDDLEDFRTVLVDEASVRWVGIKDTVGVNPAIAIDGGLGGYAFSIWLNLCDHPSTVSAPAAHSVVTCDGIQYEVASTYKPDLWTMRVDLRTLN